jgi:hypothetical protein
MSKRQKCGSVGSSWVIGTKNTKDKKNKKNEKKKKNKKKKT